MEGKTWEGMERAEEESGRGRRYVGVEAEGKEGWGGTQRLAAFLFS